MNGHTPVEAAGGEMICAECSDDEGARMAWPCRPVLLDHLQRIQGSRHGDGEYPWHCACCAAVHAEFAGCPKTLNEDGSSVTVVPVADWFRRCSDDCVP